MGRIYIQQEDLVFKFLNTGDLFEIRHGNLMLNQFRGNTLDGSLNNLYLRVWQDGKPLVYPLLGVKSASILQNLTRGLRFSGSLPNIEYTVDFRLASEQAWFWDVKLVGKDIEVDLIYAQDVGLANQGAILNNEAYVSQYIDHAVFTDPKLGYVLCSRQNQFQGTFPYLQQGSLTKAISYSTDGFQFFGLDYKATDQPRALLQENLANEVYQYEFAYTALQSPRLILNGEKQFIFYGYLVPDHPGAVEKLAFQAEIAQLWQSMEKETAGVIIQKPERSVCPSKIFQSQDLSNAELNRFYPERLEEEWQDGTLLSFFTPENEHVVLRAKELLVERPHGHILMGGNKGEITGQGITTTSYIFGVFNSQLALGNTSFNRLLSNNRSHLNVLKTSGQRLWVKLNGSWQLFTLPSAFEMGFNYARWYYKTAEETFLITNYTLFAEPEIRLEIKSLSGKAYQYRLTNQVIMDQAEFNSTFVMEAEGNNLIFRPGTDSIIKNYVPELAFVMHFSEEFTWERNKEVPLLTVELNSAPQALIVIRGQLKEEGKLSAFLPEKATLTKEKAEFSAYYNRLTKGFSLELPGKNEALLARLNILVWWYTHNMLVHFTAPRGLEQSSGGGWGTRDVCQGPAEYFMATQDYQTVRDILAIVYSHQFWEDGSWPQWFMFDEYYPIQAGESHGDIIVWPLKLLGDYLLQSGDFSILNLALPFTLRAKKEFTSKRYPLSEHVEKQIAYIEANFLPGTSLSAYGDGDWDDTLQPANRLLREYMVSSWTVALTYQACRSLGTALQEIGEDLGARLLTMADQIRADFEKYMLVDGVIPGFVYLEDLTKPKPMLHPRDLETGIHYRLLPLTRSIISELVDQEQARKNAAIIEEHLLFPDGVRLMNRPAPYSGGVSTHFQRAEQAANFGREIGLQYVHAHLRYIEAMAKLGLAQQAWEGLAAIEPIGLREVVPNAELRQRNSYFSSSDGAFKTRYSAAESFEKLKEGGIAVKGGWRIYSSGPGLYFNQLLTNCLGIRKEGAGLIIDPVLPQDFTGLRLNYTLLEKPVQFRFKFRTGTSGVLVNGQKVASEVFSNRYRQGGYRVNLTELATLLIPSGNVIEVFFQEGF